MPPLRVEAPHPAYYDGRVMAETDRPLARRGWSVTAPIRDGTSGPVVGTLHASIPRRLGPPHILRPGLIVVLALHDQLMLGAAIERIDPHQRDRNADADKLAHTWVSASNGQADRRGALPRPALLL